MRQRCLNSRHPKFRYWGGRGISICERWNSYPMFLQDMGRRPTPRHTLGRIDNDGNYEPGNVRWEFQREQVRNSRSRRRISYGGETLLLVEWAEKTGLDANLIRFRLNKGWLPGEALGIEPHVDGRSRFRPRGRRISYKGETMTIAEWSRRTGTKANDIGNRLRYGWTVGQALGLEPPRRLPDSPKMLEHGGQALTLKEWGAVLGIPWHTIKSRINILGYTIPQALGFEPRWARRD